MSTPAVSFEDLQAQLEAVGAEREELTGALRAQKAEIEAEIKRREAPLLPKITELKTQLAPILLANQMDNLKTHAFTFSVFSVETWDEKGLETYALERPEILQFRQEKIQTRLLWK